MTNLCKFYNLDRIECAAVCNSNRVSCHFCSEAQKQDWRTCSSRQSWQNYRHWWMSLNRNDVFSTEKYAAQHFPVMLCSWRILMWLESAMGLGRPFSSWRMASGYHGDDWKLSPKHKLSALCVTLISIKRQSLKVSNYKSGIRPSLCMGFKHTIINQKLHHPVNWLCLQQGVILTGAMLEVLTCEEGEASELSNILLVPEKQRPVLQAYRSTVCSGGEGQRSERFRQMSLALREQINTQSVTKKVQQNDLL